MRSWLSSAPASQNSGLEICRTYMALPSPDRRKPPLYTTYLPNLGTLDPVIKIRRAEPAL
jgi:hypothetical protein